MSEPTAAATSAKKRTQTPGIVERFNLTDGSISEAEVEAIVDLNVRAFKGGKDNDGDISQDAILGHDWTLAPAYFRHIILAGMYMNALYGVRDQESKEIVAIAIWLSPDDKPDDEKVDEFKRQTGLYDFLDRLKPPFKEWYENTIPELMKKRETFFTKEEKARRWWCIHLCTEPRYQGRGLARLMIDYIHNKARNTIQGGFIGLAAGVEINVKKYQSLGFRERGIFRSHVPDSTEMEFVIYILSRED